MELKPLTQYRSTQPAKFIPDLVEYYYSSQNKSIPSVHPMQGALLFIDVCNFTAMTEEASRKGHYGVETITRILKSYYTELDLSIRKFGGEIIKYAGDAILAVFIGDKVPTMMAIEACTRDINERLDILNKKLLPEFEFRLSYHGIKHWGRFRCIIVGDPLLHHDFILYGSAIRELFSIPLPKGSNEVKGKLRLPKSLEDSGKILKSTFVASPNPDIFLPPSVRDIITFQHFSAELRNVAILFISIDVRSISSGTFHHNLHQAFVNIQECVYRYEGIVNKIDYNDKGIVVLCSFGIPIAHLNDVQRAIIAARNIMEYTHQGIYRIGCTYSNMYAGVLGSDKRYEYGIIGSGVNAAARLLSEAEPDQILISENMLSDVEVRFKCKYLKKTPVKGFANDIKIYQIISELPVNFHSLGLLYSKQKIVAWEDELHLMANGVDSDTAPYRLFLSGEPGVGKTFLVWNLLNRLNNPKVIMMSLEEYNQPQVYNIVTTILEDYYNIPDPLQAVDRLRELTSSCEAELNLNLILEYFQGQENNHLTDGDRSIYQSIIFDQLQIFTQFLLRPIRILIVDNLHWLDKLSLSLLVAVSAVSKTHILLTSRFGLHRELFPDFKELQLANLDQPAARKLITHTFKLIADEAVEYLYRITNGNPSFIIELCREISSQRKHSNRLITLADLHDVERRGHLPNSIENLFVNRLTYFNYETQYILKLAAIIGKAFTIAELAIIDSQNIKTKVLELLDSLDTDQVFSRTNITPDLVYIFSNNLMREAIYKTILLSEKKGLHQQIADHYVQMLKAGDNSNLEIITNHYILAENAIKAYEYSILAAEKNYALANYEESSYYYEVALRFCHLQSRKIELQLALVESLFYHTEVEEANRLLNSITKPTPRVPIYSKYIYLMAKSLYLQAEYAKVAQLVNACIECPSLDHYYYLCMIFYADSLRIVNNTTELEHVLQRLIDNINHQLSTSQNVNISYSEQDFSDLKTTLQERAISVEDTPQFYYLCKIEGIYGQLSYDRGAYREAEKHFRRVMSLSHILQDNIATRISLHSLGNIMRKAGKHTKAMSYYERARTLAEKIGDRFGYLKVIMDIGILYRQQGKYDIALEAYQKSLSMAVMMGNKAQQENVLYNMGEMQYQQDQLDEAEKSFHAALEIAIEISDSLGISYANDALGDLWMARDDIDKAEQYYQNNLEYQRSINDLEGEAHSLGNLGNIATNRDDFPKALEYYEQNLKICHEIGDIDGEGRAYFNSAMASLSMGNAELSLSKLQAAQRCFHKANSAIYDDLVNEQIAICRELLKA
ncbi:MAG: hypothetical protein CVU48_03730 [Candidatus Cloacimonetes bacterium HGW-Cloacimonetes-1]|jgi:class 3 adenylate cyclase/tetratricopeptide (TPR) repeat protein|nr:MAG: hypothetical protein CVU48_03730 [Candidatus Cloacimonetes bacterium HGW-Cloacimonetes-1]